MVKDKKTEEKSAKEKFTEVIARAIVSLSALNEIIKENDLPVLITSGASVEDVKTKIELSGEFAGRTGLKSIKSRQLGSILILEFT
jgi:hypothetical protein